MFLAQLRTLLKRIGFMLAIYTLLRLAFYLLHFPVFREAGFLDVLTAFAIGLKFDLSAVSMVNLPFILFSLVPFRSVFKKAYQLVLKTWFIISNFLFLAINLIDLEYFKFIGRRTSNELFTISSDIQEQTGQLILNYWYFPVLGGLLLLLLIKQYPKTGKTPERKFNYLVSLLGLAVVVSLTVFLIRGSTGLKPLRPANAFLQQPSVLGHVSLNSTFTFIKSINEDPLEPKNYFPSQEAAAKAMDFNPEKYMVQRERPIKDNVVIIILESFATEYIGIANNGTGFTPFLDSLAAAGTYFPNNFANGRKSIDALPSIFAGLPSLMDEAYITSAFQSNTIYGIGSIVKKAGYQTSFFHGAINGTMGFNTFASIAGIEKYYGLNEYPKANYKTDFDGQWGILDEPYLQYFAKELSSHKQPFLSSVFTLSSHQPYPVPKKYKGKFPKGTLPIHESIGYTDYALKQFFKTATKQPWYKNTLFILTADHTQASANPAYQNELGNFKVPLVLFHPTKKIPAPRPLRITQQADIPATIVDYLNIYTDALLPFGTSVLNTTATGKALIYTNGTFTLVTPEIVAQLNEADQLSYVNHLIQPGLDEIEKGSAGTMLKGLTQYYRNGLIGNNLYYWKKR